MTYSRLARVARRRVMVGFGLLAVCLFAISLTLAAWNQISQLGANDSDSNDRFGAKLVRDGTSFLVGAPFDSGSKGAVYRFTPNGQGGFTQIKLTASNGASGDLFGTAIAAHNGVIVVGAPGRSNNTGVAYIFTPDGQGGYTQQSIIGNDTGVFDLWGGSVAIGENFLAVGTFFDNANRGAVYPFFPDGQGGWTQGTKIVPPDSVSGDYFAWTLAISGDTLVAASVNDDENGISDRGSLYVYIRSGQTFTQSAKILALVATQDDNLGFALAMDGTTIVAGAPGGTNANGAVFIFEPNGQGGYSESRITASDGAANDRFGAAVDVVGTTIMVGAYLDDDRGMDSGSAYLFTEQAPRNFDQVKLTALDGAVGDWFGNSVLIQAADSLMIGAIYDDMFGADAGAVYFFSSSIIPTATPTSSPTATATATPESPTATPTPVFQQLLVNGGMETDTNLDAIPDNWTAKNLSRDKLKCNTTEKTFSYTGNCAFMFRGGVNENMILQQTPTITGVTFAVSDGLYLSGFFKATNPATNAHLRLRVTYSDGTANSKMNLTIPQSADYALVDGTFDLPNANVSGVRVQIRNRSAAGKVFADDVSLLLVEAGSGVLPLPSSR